MKTKAAAILPIYESAQGIQVVLGHLRPLHPDRRYSPVPNIRDHGGEWIALATRLRTNEESTHAARRAFNQHTQGGKLGELELLTQFQDATRELHIDFYTSRVTGPSMTAKGPKYFELKANSPQDWITHIHSRPGNLDANGSLSLAAAEIGLAQAPRRNIPQGTVQALEELAQMYR